MSTSVTITTYYDYATNITAAGAFGGDISRAHVLPSTMDNVCSRIFARDGDNVRETTRRNNWTRSIKHVPGNTTRRLFYNTVVYARAIFSLLICTHVCVSPPVNDVTVIAFFTVQDDYRHLLREHSWLCAVGRACRNTMCRRIDDSYANRKRAWARLR